MWRESECGKAVAHDVLQRPTFGVVQDLMRGGLVQVDDRLARQMVWLDRVKLMAASGAACGGHPVFQQQARH